jgi:hypothetical protein
MCSFTEPGTVEGEQVVLSLQGGRAVPHQIRPTGECVCPGSCKAVSFRRASKGRCRRRGVFFYFHGHCRAPRCQPHCVAGARSGEQVKGSAQHLKDPALAPVSVSHWANQVELLIDMLKDRASTAAYKLEAAFAALQKRGAGARRWRRQGRQPAAPPSSPPAARAWTTISARLRPQRLRLRGTRALRIVANTAACQHALQARRHFGDVLGRGRPRRCA